MPKKKPTKPTNRIAHLHWQQRADGTAIAHWKPSPRLRRAGWTNLMLGTDPREAVMKAMARNDEVAAWEKKGTAEALRIDPAADPRTITFAGAVDRYRRHPAFTLRKPKTQLQYTSSLRTLAKWAQDGALRLRDLDREMVVELRNALVESNRPYRTATLLRMLGVFLQWCEDERLIAANPATKLKIPEPPKRRSRLRIEDMHWIEDAAAELGHEHVGLAVVFGFFTMQREGDLLAATSFSLPAITDISPQARRALAGPDGRVTGFVLVQQKTTTPVAVALHPRARVAIEAAIAARATEKVAGGHVIMRAGQTGAVAEWRFQRDFRAVVNHAVAQASERGDHDIAQLLEGFQFRDIRRSGMCWLRDLGVPVPMIAANSGHSIKQTQKILDTYLPADTYAAAEGMAMAVLRQAERDAEAAMEDQG